jgi:hypothetical protein
MAIVLNCPLGIPHKTLHRPNPISFQTLGLTIILLTISKTSPFPDGKAKNGMLDCQFTAAFFGHFHLQLPSFPILTLHIPPQ